MLIQTKGRNVHILNNKHIIGMKLAYERKAKAMLKIIQGKLGQRIRTKVDFSGVPAGTEGIVAQVDNLSKITLGIVWDMPRMVPLVDWFTISEYEDYLDEIESKPWTGPVWDAGHLNWKRVYIQPAQRGGYEICLATPINEGYTVLGHHYRLDLARDEIMRRQESKQVSY